MILAKLCAVAVAREIIDVGIYEPAHDKPIVYIACHGPLIVANGWNIYRWDIVSILKSQEMSQLNLGDRDALEPTLMPKSTVEEADLVDVLTGNTIVSELPESVALVFIVVYGVEHDFADNFVGFCAENKVVNVLVFPQVKCLTPELS